jgi:hypothetical protein
MKGTKTMRSLIRTSFLVLALSCSAYAGEMPFPGDMPFPGPPKQTSVQEPTISEIQDQSATESTLTEVALNLLRSALSLF